MQSKHLFRTVVLTLLLVPGLAQAVAITWKVAPPDGLWSNLNNWTPAQVPVAADTVTFNNNSSTLSVDLNGNQAAASLTFDTAACGAYTISNNMLTLSAGITVNSTVTTTQTINSAVAITGNQSFTNNSTAAGQTLTFGGSVTATTGTPTLTVTGTGNLAVNGALGNGGGTLALTKTGAGVATFTASSAFTGNTSASGGQTVLSGANGAFTSTGAVTIGGNSALVFDNTAAANSTRLNTAATITMGNNAELRLLGNSTADVNQTAGPLTMSGDGRMTMTITPNLARNAAITFASVARNNATTLLLRGPGLGAGAVGSNPGGANVVFTTSTGLNSYKFGDGGALGTTTQSIISFIAADASPTGSGTDLVSYDATNGLHMLTPSEYTSTIADGQGVAPSPLTKYNVKLAGTVPNLTTDTLINSLVLGAGGGVDIFTGKKLTLFSGTILAADNNNGIGTAAGVGTLTMGGSDAVFHTPRDLVINSNLSMAGKTFTKQGVGTITLNGTCDAAGFRIHQGTVRMGMNNLFTNTSASLTNNASAATLDMNGFDQTFNGGWGSQYGFVITNTNLSTTSTFSSNNGGVGILAGNLNYTFTGAGTSGFNGGLQHTGWTWVQQGTFGSSGGGGALSPYSPVLFGTAGGTSGILDVGNRSETIGGLSTVGGTANAVGIGGATARTLTIRTDGADYAFAGAIKNNIGAGTGTPLALVKTGPNKQTLSGANNYTGTTAVNGGTLALDFTTDNTNKISAAALTLAGGGSLSIQGNAGAPTSQSVAGLTLSAGDSAISVSRGGGQSATLNLGAITSRASGSTLDFTLPASGAITTSTANNAYGILGGYATVGHTDWARNDGSNNVAAFSAYTLQDNPASWTVNQNISDSAGFSGTAGTVTLSTLRFNAAGGGTVSVGTTLTVGPALAGGILVTPNVTAATAINGGSLTTAGTDIVVIQNSAAALTIASKITGGKILTKSGPGLLILNGANDYTGVTYINNGTVQLGNASALGTTAGATTVNLGGTLDLNGQTVGAEAITAYGTGGGGNGALVNSNTGSPASLSGTVSLPSFDVGVGGAGDLTLSGVLSSSFGVNKLGTGKLTLTNTNTYTGKTTVTAGNLSVNGSIATSSGTVVNAGATLSGSGTVSSITGDGLVSPGNSAGILTATQLNAANGNDFAFEFTASGSPDYTNAAGSLNDVLHLTGAVPFYTPLAASNTVDLYFKVATLNSGDLFRGGFYADNYGDWRQYVEDATFNYYIKGDGNGPISFNGVSYYLMSSYFPVLTPAFSTVAESANFAFGTASGYVTQWSFVIPEPSAAILLLGALAGGLRRRQREHRNPTEPGT